MSTINNTVLTHEYIIGVVKNFVARIRQVKSDAPIPSQQDLDSLASRIMKLTTLPTIMSYPIRERQMDAMALFIQFDTLIPVVTALLGDKDAGRLISVVLSQFLDPYGHLARKDEQTVDVDSIFPS